MANQYISSTNVLKAMVGYDDMVIFHKHHLRVLGLTENKKAVLMLCIYCMQVRGYKKRAIKRVLTSTRRRRIVVKPKDDIYA